MKFEIGDYVVKNDKHIQRMMRMYKQKLEEISCDVYQTRDYDKKNKLITVTFKNKVYVYQANEIRKATETEIKIHKLKHLFKK